MPACLLALLLRLCRLVPAGDSRGAVARFRRFRSMARPAILALLSALALPAPPAAAQTNAALLAPTPAPFAVATVARLRFPWRIAFLPDGRMLVTEKPGGVVLVTPAGAVTRVAGVPAVEYKGQGGMLGVFAGPTFARDRLVYLTYSEPGDGGSSLALARARLVETAGAARLDGLTVLWRELPKGRGGQFGAIVAFAPDGRSLFLSVGERQRFTPAQDPDSALGKILHLTLDGRPAPGNPGAGRVGSPTVPLFPPPADTVAAAALRAPRVRLDRPNLAPAETWASGVRTPYGLAFDDRGRLWEVEHGPMGGDELNLIVRGGNYGWPLVSYGDNYDGVPIPRPGTRPDLAGPALYWKPVIAPGGFAFYRGDMFPGWRGSALVSGLAGQSLTRIAFDAGGGARAAEVWKLGHRVRDVAVAPDGAVWLVEDETAGRLLRLTPK